MLRSICEDYPNLTAQAEGCGSGRFDWSLFKSELQFALRELSRFRVNRDSGKPWGRRALPPSNPATLSPTPSLPQPTSVVKEGL